MIKYKKVTKRGIAQNQGIARLLTHCDHIQLAPTHTNFWPAAYGITEPNQRVAINTHTNTRQTCRIETPAVGR